MLATDNCWAASWTSPDRRGNRQLHTTAKKVILGSHLGEGDVGCDHGGRWGCGWNTGLLYQTLEHPLVLCLGVEQVFNPLLLITKQM